MISGMGNECLVGGVYQIVRPTQGARGTVAPKTYKMHPVFKPALPSSAAWAKQRNDQCSIDQFIPPPPDYWVRLEKELQTKQNPKSSVFCQKVEIGNMWWDDCYDLGVPLPGEIIHPFGVDIVDLFLRTDLKKARTEVSTQLGTSPDIDIQDFFNEDCYVDQFGYRVNIFDRLGPEHPGESPMISLISKKGEVTFHHDGSFKNVLRVRAETRNFEEKAEWLFIGGTLAYYRDDQILFAEGWDQRNAAHAYGASIHAFTNSQGLYGAEIFWNGRSFYLFKEYLSEEWHPFEPLDRRRKGRYFGPEVTVDLGLQYLARGAWTPWDYEGTLPIQNVRVESGVPHVVIQGKKQYTKPLYENPYLVHNDDAVGVKEILGNRNPSYQVKFVQTNEDGTKVDSGWQPCDPPRSELSRLDLCRFREVEICPPARYLFYIRTGEAEKAPPQGWELSSSFYNGFIIEF